VRNAILVLINSVFFVCYCVHDDWSVFTKFEAVISNHIFERPNSISFQNTFRAASLLQPVMYFFQLEYLVPTALFSRPKIIIHVCKFVEINGAYLETVCRRAWCLMVFCFWCLNCLKEARLCTQRVAVVCGFLFVLNCDETDGMMHHNCLCI